MTGGASCHGLLVLRVAGVIQWPGTQAHYEGDMMNTQHDNERLSGLAWILLRPLALIFYRSRHPLRKVISILEYLMDMPEPHKKRAKKWGTRLFYFVCIAVATGCFLAAQIMGA